MAASGSMGMLASRPACFAAGWRPLLTAARRERMLQAVPAGALAGARQVGGPHLQASKPRLPAVCPCATASGDAPKQAGSPGGSARDIDRKIRDASYQMSTSLGKAAFKLFRAVWYLGLMWLTSKVVPGRRFFTPVATLTLKHEGRPPTTYGFSIFSTMLIWHTMDAAWFLFDALCAWATLARLKRQQQQQRRQRWRRHQP